MRNYKLFVEDIKQAIQKIIKYTQNLSFDDFSHDEKTIDAVIRNFEIIGEAAKNIPDSIKESHPEIDWKAIIGMRNITIHEYFGIDLEEIWETIKDDIPQLELHINSIDICQDTNKSKNK